MSSLLSVTAGTTNLGKWWCVAGGPDVRCLMMEHRESRENNAEVMALVPAASSSKIPQVPSRGTEHFFDQLQVASSSLELDGRRRCAITSNWKGCVGFTGAYILSKLKACLSGNIACPVFSQYRVSNCLVLRFNFLSPRM